MKKLLMLLTATMMFLSVFLSSAQPGMASSTSLDEATIQINGENVHVKNLSKDMNSTKFEITFEGQVEVIDVDYRTQMFTITDSEGVQTTYNANDYIINDDQTDQPLIKDPGLVKDKDFPNNEIAPASPNRSKSYFYDLPGALNMSGTIRPDGSYLRGSQNINVYKIEQWADIVRLKQFHFSKGTAASLVVGSIVALLAAPEAAVIGILGAIAGFVNWGFLTDDLKLHVGVKRQTIGKGYFVGSRGYATKTKVFNDYIMGKGINGVLQEQLYASGNYYNYFYNDWSNSSVASVAFQQHRYIEGLRSTVPTWGENY